MLRLKPIIFISFFGIFLITGCEQQEIKTDSRIKIIHSGVTLKGTGARVLPRQKWAILQKKIRANDTENRIITCDGPLEVDYKERKAIFNNNVEIKEKEGMINANKVVAYIDPEKKTIEKIEWLGDVKCTY